ncbi:MAG: DNA polymerase I, partial [Chloroflexi bacterium]|nr:DNA polymerase I [Chloroflexota bacterium]
MAKQKTASLIPERPVFMVIDGHSMLFRAYYALAPQLAFTLRATGEPIGAVFNFVNMLLRAWQDVQPDYWAIAFDPPGKTFRDDMYAEYKMGRAPTPDELISQFARVHQVIEVLGMPSLEIAGYEADDVIGTLSRMATEHGLDTVILSGDTDEMQLVGPHVRIRYQAMRKGISETTMYDVGKVRGRFGLEPRQVI